MSEVNNKFSNEEKARAKAVSIVELAQSLGLEVKKNKALCFGGHDSKTESLTFYPDSNTFHCFGCSKHGDTIALVMAVKGCLFREAVESLLGGRPGHSPPSPLKASNRAANSLGGDYSDIYEFFIKILPFPDENHYLVKERCLSSEVLINNDIKAVDQNQTWTCKGRLLECFTIERLISSGLISISGKGHGYLFFFQCCAVVPFYKDGRVIYLQGIPRPELRSKIGKSKNLSGIEKPSMYFPKSFTTFNPEKHTIHIVEGCIDALSILTMSYKAIGTIDAGIKEYADLDKLKDFPIALIGDRDLAGFEAKLRIYEYLKKKHFNVQSISVAALSLAILKSADSGIKDINDILVQFKKRKGQ